MDKERIIALVNIVLDHDIDNDNEAAASMERILYRDLLRAIAAGTCECPRECAKLALKTQGFGFRRWP